MEVGSRIREGREAKGLSQEALAREVFVSRQTVSNWETGKTYPDVQSLLLLSNLFGVTVDSLVKGDVEAMKEAEKRYARDRIIITVGYTVGLVMLALAMVVGPLLVRGQLPLLSPFVYVPLVISMAAFAVANYVERHNDMKTPGEVLAFLEGGDPDQIARERKPVSWRWVVIVCLVGFFISFIAGFLQAYFFG